MEQTLRSGGECYLIGGSAWILPVFYLSRAKSVTTYIGVALYILWHSTKLFAILDGVEVFVVVLGFILKPAIYN